MANVGAIIAGTSITMVAELEYSRTTVSWTMKEFLKQGKYPINRRKLGRPRIFNDMPGPASVQTDF